MERMGRRKIEKEREKRRVKGREKKGERQRGREGNARDKGQVVKREKSMLLVFLIFINNLAEQKEKIIFSE